MNKIVSQRAVIYGSSTVLSDGIQRSAPPVQRNVLCHHCRVGNGLRGQGGHLKLKVDSVQLARSGGYEWPRPLTER